MLYSSNMLHILKKEDEYFPWRLKILEDCPDIIYVLGNVSILNEFYLAIVGSRVCDEYGKKITRYLVDGLVQSGVGIVSGLAEGIDTEAHEETLLKHGKTIAILGSGFEYIYPSCNYKLLERIVENGGAIISEYMPDEMPKRFYFPKRNRLVACISEGVIVTQARQKSGALITARLAQKYKKKVFAVPGNLDSNKAKGGNELLQKGAKLVVDVEDILNEFPTYSFKNIIKEKITVPEQYQTIYNLLQENAMSINEISKKTNKSIQEVMVQLTMLEMDGYIKELPGKVYDVKI